MYKLLFIHDPSIFILICWFGTQETFLIIINIENCIFVETIFLFYRIICLIESLKQQHLFEI